MRNKRKFKKIYNPVSTIISGIVGTGIHAYSQFLVNNEHLENICEDLSSGRYLSGVSKIIGPYVLPYAVSFIAGKISSKKVREEYEGKINDLEQTIKKLSKKIETALFH